MSDDQRRDSSDEELTADDQAAQPSSDAVPTRVVVETDQVRGFDLLMPDASLIDVEDPDEDDGELLEAVPDDLFEGEAPAAAAGAPPPPPAAAATSPTVEPLVAPAEAPAEASGDGLPSRAYAVEPAFYQAEARALQQRQPERAALMFVEAASAAERAGASLDLVVGDLEAALALRADSPWLLPRARRMLMRLRSYQRALKLGKREVETSGDAATKAAVLLEAAAVVRHYAADAQTALGMIGQALTLQPSYVAALARAVALGGELQQHADTATALERLAAALTDPTQRSLCLCAAGTLHETHLDQEEPARAAYSRAVEADPQCVPAVLALCELEAQAERWPLYCRGLEQLAELLQEPVFGAHLLLEAGTIHLDQTGDLDAAARDLARAARASQASVKTLQRLAETHEVRGRSRERAQTLRELLELQLGRQSRAALLTEIGHTHTALHEVDQALSAYREALEVLPGYVPALQALGTTYRRQGDLESLVEIACFENESLLPREARAVRHVEIADLLAGPLKRPNDAVETYERALEIWPELHLAHWGAQRLLRRLERFDRLAALLTRQAEVSSDPLTRDQLRWARAQLEAGPLEDAERALETLRSCDRSQQPRIVINDMIALCERAGRHAELVELLLEQAEGTSDAQEAECRRVQAAGVLERELEEPERALQLLREVIDANPRSYPAIHGAGRIMHRLGAWNDLVKLHHHELVTDPDRADAALLLCRMGRVLAEHVGHNSAAISAYVKALAKDAACTPALVALERLARAEGRFEPLIKGLERYADAEPDTAASASALCRAAELASWRAGDLELAQTLYQRALERDVECELAHRGLLRVQLRMKEFSSAAAQLAALGARAGSPAERALLALHEARLREFRLGDPPDLLLYQQAADGPFGDRLREEIVRVRRLVVETSGERGEITRHLVALAGETKDSALAAAHFLDAAHTMEFGGDGAEDVRAAVDQAYQREPAEPATIWCLERQLQRLGCWVELAELNEREAQLEVDRAQRVQRLCAAADAHYRAEADDAVERVCREALNFDAHCLSALQLLARVAEQREQWRTLAELSDRLAEACADPSNRRASCLRAAEIWRDRVDDVQRALASLAVALADDPGDAEAFRFSEELLRQREDYEELSRLYQRRLRACEDDAARVELLLEHAALQRDALDQPERAIAELNALLRVSPAHERALAEIAQLHLAQRHWSDAATVLARLAEQTTDPEARVTHQLRLAELWLERLHEPQRARAVLEAVEAARPEDLAVKKLRARLAMTVGDWSDARALLEPLAQRSGEGGLWALAQLAAVAELGLHDAALASRSRRDALAAAIRDPQALDAWRAGLTDSADVRRLADEAQKMLGEESLAADEAAALRALLARLLADALDQPAEAIRQLRELVAADPQQIAAARQLGQLLERQGDAAGALDCYRALLDAVPGDAEGYRGVARCGPPGVAAAAERIAALLAGEEGAGVAAAPVQEPRGALPSAALQLAPQHRPVVDLLRFAAPVVDEAFPPPGEGLLPADHPAAQAAAPLARALGLPPPVVCADGRVGAAIVGAEPLTVAVNTALVKRPEEPAFRFAVARALAGALHGGAVWRRFGNEGAVPLLEALDESVRGPGVAAAELRRVLLGRLPRKARKELEQRGVARCSGTPAVEYCAALAPIVDRAALVLSGDVGAALGELAAGAGIALSAIGADAQLAGLLRFAVSDDYDALSRSIE